MLTEYLTIHHALRRYLLLTVFCAAFLFCSHFGNAQSTTPTNGGSSSFTANLINIEAAANETFRYTTSLYNAAKEQRVYDLKADLPIGWLITYRTEGSQISSLNLTPGKTQNINIEINATATAKPGKYKIPVKAISSSDTLLLNLEAVVKGSYKIELSTPTGRLSEELTSGSQKKIQLVIKNSGTLPLNDLELSAQSPSKWETSFEPSKIKQLEPGKTLDVTATLSVPDKTIAGDYATTFSVKNPNANDDAAFRIIVKTSALSGWIGILIILLAIALVYYLIRKYGRR